MPVSRRTRGSLQTLLWLWCITECNVDDIWSGLPPRIIRIRGLQGRFESHKICETGRLVYFVTTLSISCEKDYSRGEYLIIWRHLARCRQNFTSGRAIYCVMILGQDASHDEYLIIWWHLARCRQNFTSGRAIYCVIMRYNPRSRKRKADGQL